MRDLVFLYGFMRADWTCIWLQVDFFHCRFICKLISCITDDTKQKHGTEVTKTTLFFCCCSKIIKRKTATDFIPLIKPQAVLAHTCVHILYSVK